MDDPGNGLELGVTIELGLDPGAVPDQQKLGLAVPAERDGSAWNDHGGADVAPHGVKRNTNLAWHLNPGNLVWRGRQLAGPRNGFAMDMTTGQARRRTPTGARQ